MPTEGMPRGSYGEEVVVPPPRWHRCRMGRGSHGGGDVQGRRPVISLPTSTPHSRAMWLLTGSRPWRLAALAVVLITYGLTIATTVRLSSWFR